MEKVRADKTKEEREKEREKERMEAILAKHEKNVFKRVFGYNTDKKILFALGILIAVVNGLIYPCFAIFLSRIITSLF